MRDSINAWIDSVIARHSEGTSKTYKCHLRQFLTWLDGRAFKQHLLEDYIAECVKRKYAKITINGKISAVKDFSAWYCPRHDLEDPFVNVPHFKHSETLPTKRRFLTAEEYSKVLLVAEDGIELDTIEFLANTGLRRSEFVQFHTKAINKAQTHFAVVGKGNKKRQVPLNTRIKEVIARSVQENGNLRCVTFWRGDADRIWDNCQSLARRANIPAFGPHALRHYFATALIKKGVPLKLVSQILGHSSVLITEQIYCHLLPEDTTGITEVLCV